MSMWNGIIGMALGFQVEMQVGHELKKEELQARWRKSALMPRKKKKQERKHLKSTWDILMWSEENVVNRYKIF